MSEADRDLLRRLEEKRRKIHTMRGLGGTILMPAQSEDPDLPVEAPMFWIPAERGIVEVRMSWMRNVDWMIKFQREVWELTKEDRIRYVA